MTLRVPSPKDRESVYYGTLSVREVKPEGDETRRDEGVERSSGKERRYTQDGLGVGCRVVCGRAVLGEDWADAEGVLRTPLQCHPDLGRL